MQTCVCHSETLQDTLTEQLSEIILSGALQSGLCSDLVVRALVLAAARMCTDDGEKFIEDRLLEYSRSESNHLKRLLTSGRRMN